MRKINKPRIDMSVKLYKDAGVLTDAYERDRQWMYRANPARPKNTVLKTMVFNYNKTGEIPVEGGAGIGCGTNANPEVVNGFMGK